MSTALASGEIAVGERGRIRYCRKDISKKVYNLEFLKKLPIFKKNIGKDLKRAYVLEKGPAIILKRGPQFSVKVHGF